ncbi:hypothetical protein GCM10010335_67720 [Streptomyces galbus]|nr:hypothetical protein GCM10010335_67720 [Streptomyces galbus]
MAKPQFETVCPPGGEFGGRLVHIDGVPAGRAYGLWDLVVFLRRAGPSEGLADEDEIAASELIEWLGGGPDEGVVNPGTGEAGAHSRVRGGSDSYTRALSNADGHSRLRPVRRASVRLTGALCREAGTGRRLLAEAAGVGET